MKKYAVIENNKVVNVLIGVDPDLIEANPEMYLDYTDGWDYNNDIDGGNFFPLPTIEEALAE